MPIESSIVGTASEPLVHEIDARWTMAYAAGLTDTLPCYLDTLRPQGVIAHPLFPVCFEWPAMLDLRKRLYHAQLTPEENVRAVHATHDLLLRRPVRPGDRLTTRATIAGVERRKPGAYMVVRFDTVDAGGTTVCETWEGVIYRNVEVAGPDRPATQWPRTPAPVEADGKARAEFKLPIPAVAAHVYTECARIWNPVHTDAAVAAAAGLPAIILHGTATLALAVSRIIEAEPGGDPERVARIAGRFAAMVLMPSEVVVRILSRTPIDGVDGLFFEVLNAEGQRAVRDGYIELRPESRGRRFCQGEIPLEGSIPRGRRR